MPWYFYNRDGYPVGPKSPAFIPTGALVFSPLPYTSPEPDGYLFCNGQAVLKNSYLDLFTEIGILYGSTLTTFTLPNFQDMFLRGINTAAGIGLGGGSATHQHTLGAHDHPVNLNHSHSSSAHQHALPVHTHTQATHKHEAGTLTVQNPSPNFNNAKLSGGPAPPDQISSSPTHKHGINVFGNSGLNGLDFSQSGSSSGVNTDPLSPALNAFTVTSSTASANELSTAETTVPPFISMSVLIKT